MREPLVLAAIVVLGMLGFPAASPAQTPTIVGSLANFDVVNDTEFEKEGFEIQLENVHVEDVTRVFGQAGAACYIRYCIGSVTEYPPIGTTPGGVIIRWAAKYDAANKRFVTPASAPGGGSSGTPSVAGIPHPFFSGEQCWSVGQGAAYPTSGCEHFGVSLLRNPTKTIYRWLKGDPDTGLLAPAANTPPVAVAHPVVAVIPPAVAGGVPEVQAIVQAPAPAVNPALAHRYGKAQWVKVYKTELGRDAGLDELVGGHPNDVVPNREHAGESETAWKLLQFDVTNPDKGGSRLQSHGSPGGGSRAVLRRYEFYKYTGPVVAPGGTSGKGGTKLSTDDQEQSACPRDANGECTAPGPGELGDYIGAQMVAQNLQHGIVPAITWATPVAIGYGTALSTAQLNAIASDPAGGAIAGTFSYTPEAGAIPSAGTQTLQVIFTPDNAAAYNSQTRMVLLTVNKAAQTIGFAAPADQVYNALAFTVSATGGGSANPVTFTAADACSVSGDQVRALHVGTCTLTASQAGDDNFIAAAPVSRSFSITPAPLTVSANSASKTYGDTTTFTGTEFTTSGLQAGDAVSSVTLTSDGAAANASAGPHSIVASAAVGAGLDNYAISYSDGTLTVLPATLTVAAKPQTKRFGEADPPLTFETGALQAGDTAAGALTGSLIRAAGESVGSYAITQGTLAAVNYVIVFTGSTLDITPASQTIAFGPLANRTFGDAPFTVSATGGASGNAVTFSAAGNCTVLGNVVTLTSAGGCTITASQAGTTNYTAATPVAQSFTIAAAPTSTNPIVNPGYQVSREGDEVDLQIRIAGGTARKGDDGRRRDSFAATGLPGGLSIDKDGSIEGHVRKNSAGVYSVTVMFTQGGQTYSQSFRWTILKNDGRKDDDRDRDDRR